MKPLLPLMAASAVAVACASTPGGTVTQANDSDASAVAEAASLPHDAAAPADAAAATDAAADTALLWCAELKAKMQRCDGELECGVNFDAWCTQQARTNSHAFEVTDTACVNRTCKSGERAACRYAGYEAAGLSAAGTALAEAYCATCTEVPACLQSTTTYRRGAAVSDAFVAAWELSDGIAEEIRAKCTGSALKVGPTGCVRSFGSCAADVYLAALPSCP